MHEELQERGFIVRLEEDLSGAGMRRAVDQLVAAFRQRQQVPEPEREVRSPQTYALSLSFCSYFSFYHPQTVSKREQQHVCERESS